MTRTHMHLPPSSEAFLGCSWFGSIICADTMSLNKNSMWLPQELTEAWLSSLVSQQSYGPFALKCYTGLLEADLLPSDMHEIMTGAVSFLHAGMQVEHAQHPTHPCNVPQDAHGQQHRSSACASSVCISMCPQAGDKQEYLNRRCFAQVAHYLSSMINIRVLTLSDCLDLISSDMALAQHGLAQQLHEGLSTVVRPLVTRLEASSKCVLWFRGIDASLQYAWDCFSNHIFPSKQPLTEVI